jgi:hypothetical protein
MIRRFNFYTITIVFGTLVFLACRHPKNQKESNRDYSNVKPSISYFIDNRQVSEKYFFELYQKDSLIYVAGTTDPRISIITYGEKFRNGVFYFKKRI